jgi:hypothetical protein
MATLNLSAYKPSSGQLISASPISNAFTAIEAAVNSIDNTQFASGRIFDPTKLIEASSVQRIADSTAGGAVANIDFTSISANFLSILAVLYLRGDTAASNTPVSLRFNNDSSSAYDVEAMTANSTTVSAAGTASGAATQGQCGRCPANTAPANAFSGGMVMIPNYSSTTGHKPWFTIGQSREASGGTSDNVILYTGGIWAQTPAAISRITFLPGAGNFVAGSRISLYGLG